jgi:hypothetical protein
VKRLALALFVAACGGGSPAGSAAPAPDAGLEVRVAIGRAPVIAEPKKNKVPLEHLTEGDVVEVVRPAGSLAWSRDGEARRGDLVEIRRTARDGLAYAWVNDLAPAPALPSAAEICAGAAGCAASLRRAVVPAGVLAWEVCAARACGFYLMRGAKRETWSEEGVTEVRRVTVAGRALALVTRLWSRGQVTGSEVVVLPLDGAPFAPSLRIPADEIDARAAPVRQRQGTVAVEGDRLVYRGTVRLVAPDDGRELSSEPVVETHGLR